MNQKSYTTCFFTVVSQIYIFLEKILADHTTVKKLKVLSLQDIIVTTFTILII